MTTTTVRVQLVVMGLATLGLVAFAGPSTARAAGVVGSGTAASCTDAALDVALSGGGLVTFDCGPGTVSIDISPGAGGSGTKTISTDTTIDGGGLITISGGNSVRVFIVNGTGMFTLQNLTIANGDSAGDGGGIASGGSFGGNATLIITNSTFTGNRSSFYGGGIISNTPVIITNSTFTGNRASGYGGGIISYDGAPLTITNSTFSDNSSTGDFTFSGGGAISKFYGTLTITNATFSGNSVNNSAGGYGGAVSNTDSTLTVTNTIFADSPGGNCYNASGTITDGGHNVDDGTTCGFTGAGCAIITGTSFCNTNPELDPSGLANNGGPTQTIALCMETGVPASCTGASPAIDGGDETICMTTTGTAPVNNLDQRAFSRPGTGHTNCSIGAYEADLPTPTPTPTVTPSSTPSATPTNSPVLRGMVRYYRDDRPVPGAQIEVVGGSGGGATDSLGQFGLADVGAGPLTLQPKKVGDFAGGISSLDAAFALQIRVGLRTADALQKVACDVTGNGTISSLDAARILQFKVNLINRLPVADTCGSDWAFFPDPAAAPNQTLIDPEIASGTCQPGRISYDPLVTPLADQDFIAVLFGDCTGNWEP